jgi:predicted GNAT family N-acyltransferase
VNPSLKVYKISDKVRMEIIFAIRHEVFVMEQKVDPEEEFDEFEDGSFHFLAYCDQEPAGVARWRFNTYGIKLERFAVLKKFRSKGVGSALVIAVEHDIRNHPDVSSGVKMYMHSQVTAVPLYEKFGFIKKGDLFLECSIEHFVMEKII